MRRRELRSVRTEDRVGSVGLGDDGKPFLTGGAKDIFRRIGTDAAAVKGLLDDGWSNGYLYLSDEKGSGDVRVQQRAQ